MSVAGQVMGSVVGRLPPRVIRSMASQYAAGETVDDAMREVVSLRQRGIAATAAVLGEAATTEAYADQHLREVRSMLDELKRRPDVDVRLGVKLTALGVGISRHLASRNLRLIAADADSQHRIVEVDVEQLSYVDDTLALVLEARTDSHTNVYAVVQAYLYRTASDIEALVSDGIPTRIVKGAYKEGARHAFQLYESVRENYVALARRYLEAGVPVGIATHDEYVILRLLNLVSELGVAPDAYEFQMIMGIQEALRQRLVEAGHRVRVTVHFGSDLHLWSVRRLKENPEIARYALGGIRDAVRHRRRLASS